MMRGLIGQANALMLRLAGRFSSGPRREWTTIPVPLLHSLPSPLRSPYLHLTPPATHARRPQPRRVHGSTGAWWMVMVMVMAMVGGGWWLLVGDGCALLSFLPFTIQMISRRCAVHVLYCTVHTYMLKTCRPPYCWKIPHLTKPTHRQSQSFEPHSVCPPGKAFIPIPLSHQHSPPGHRLAEPKSRKCAS